MAIDITIKEVLLEVQKEQKELGVELSIEEIGEIVTSQFVASRLAFQKGIEVRLPYFGAFIRKHGLEKGLAAKALAEFKDVFDEETYKRKVLEAKIANKKASVQRRVKVVKMTFKDLSAAPKKHNNVHKYDKLL